MTRDLLTLVMRLRQVNMFTARAREGQRLNTILCENQFVSSTDCRTAEQSSRRTNKQAIQHSRALVCACPTSRPPNCNIGSSPRCTMEFVSFCGDVNDFIPATSKLCNKSCTFVLNFLQSTQQPCNRASRKKTLSVPTDESFVNWHL